MNFKNIMVFTFYNTLSRKKEILRLHKNRKVDIYVCGPTVYDFAHLGHGRVNVIFDGLVKTLRHVGFDVRYLQNITDLDDKIIDRAKEKSVSPKALARQFEKEYMNDMRMLKINSITIYARASEHIEEIQSQIKRLLQNNSAYITTNGVYFNVKKFTDYGKLSNQNLSEIRDTERIGHDPEKKDIRDFVVWKRSKPGEPKWPSPWGEGRPGWHIEDTAIAEKYFGQQYDIHGSALDLIFPHHESEIALMETISGKKPYVTTWLHAGFLTVRGEKMSKSLGNMILLRDLLKNYSAETFRLLIFQTHYRSPIDYDEDLMKQADAAAQRLTDFFDRISKIRNYGPENSQLTEKIKTIEEKFWDVLTDDFDTPRALASLFSLVKDLNPLIENASLSKKEIRSVLQFLKDINKIFGIIKTKQTLVVPQEVKDLAAERELFRKEKRWNESDQSRKQLFGLGWLIEDTPDGPRLKKVTN